MQRLRDSLASLARANQRLAEATALGADNPVIVDGVIQRFEFALELTWKTLKRALAMEGIEASTPREVLTQAARAGWLPDEAPWLGMLKDRNLTSHIYDEATARAIYDRIRERYQPALAELLALLQRRYPPAD